MQESRRCSGTKIQPILASSIQGPGATLRILLIGRQKQNSHSTRWKTASDREDRTSLRRRWLCETAARESEGAQMSRVLIIALVVLAAVGGTGPAGASAGHRESRPAIAPAPAVAAWSLPASAQTLQIEQAGSGPFLKAPETDCAGGAGPEAAPALDGYCLGFGGRLGYSGPELGGLGKAEIWRPAQEVDVVGQTRSLLTAFEAPVTLQNAGGACRHAPRTDDPKPSRSTGHPSSFQE